MSRLFGLDIAGIVNSEIAGAGGVRPAVLTKPVPGTRTPGSLSGGTNPTTTTHAARGFEDSLSRLRPETIVTEAAGLVVLLGASIVGGVEPEAGDSVSLDGGDNQRIVRVESDPANATYECQVA